MAVINITQTGFQAGLKGSISIPSETGNYSVSLPGCLGYSDRCPQFGVNDPRAWAYNISLGVNCTFRVTKQSDNSLNVKVDAFTSWRVTRNQGATPPGLSVIRGSYLFYSSINGALIHHYNGPPTSGQGTTSWNGSGGTQTFDLGNIPAGSESAPKEYGHSSNAVNGLIAQAHISVKNDLPPDYRPGERLTGGTWRSLNRQGGACERNASWYEMRTIGGTGDPPERMNGGWKNMKKIGAE